MTNALTLDAPAGQPVITGRREFEARAALVFRAWTDRDLIAQWLGPRKYTMTVDKWDARSGGEYRYVHSDGDEQFAFHGTFHTVRPDDLLVQTFEFEGWPDVVSLDTLRFVELGERCRIEQFSVFPSVEARDAMVDSGMEYGVREGYERLDELIARG